MIDHPLYDVKPFFVAAGIERRNGRYWLQYVSDTPADTRAGHDHLKTFRYCEINRDSAIALQQCAHSAGWLNVDYKDDSWNWKLSFRRFIAWPAANQATDLASALFAPAQEMATC